MGAQSRCYSCLRALVLRGDNSMVAEGFKRHEEELGKVDYHATSPTEKKDGMAGKTPGQRMKAARLQQSSPLGNLPPLPGMDRGLQRGVEKKQPCLLVPRAMPCPEKWETKE